MSIFEEIIFSLSVALKKKRYLCKDRWEKSSALRKRFCFIRVTEIANFKQKDRDNVTLILYLYRLRIRMCRIPYHYTYRRENIVSSFIFARRLAMPGDW